MGSVLQFHREDELDPQYKGALGIACTFESAGEYTVAAVHCRVTNDRPVRIDIYVEDPSGVLLKKVKDFSEERGEVVFMIAAREITYMHLNYVPGDVGLIQCMLTPGIRMAKDLHQILEWEGQPKRSWSAFTAD
jgi:hypothetical protein